MTLPQAEQITVVTNSRAENTGLPSHHRQTNGHYRGCWIR